MLSRGTGITILNGSTALFSACSLDVPTVVKAALTVPGSRTIGAVRMVTAVEEALGMAATMTDERWAVKVSAQSNQF